MLLDKKFQRNTSKFAIFYINENSKLLFPFFISCYFIFFTNEYPGLCRHRPGHSLVKKIKLLEMKNEKTTRDFLLYKYSKFWSVFLEFKLEHKPLILEVCEAWNSVFYWFYLLHVKNGFFFAKWHSTDACAGPNHLLLIWQINDKT